MGAILHEYQWIIILAIIIVTGFIVLLNVWPMNKKAHLNDALNFFKDLISIFYGNNFTVTLWFTFLMVLSIVAGLLGLLVGASHEFIPEHSHWVTLEIILIWSIAIISLRLISKQTIIRSLLFVFISIIALFLCFRLFEWPYPATGADKYGFIIGIASFMVSAIGIFVSIRVFMQINTQNKVNSVDKYLNETISIIKSAAPEDEVYIIAPSFCIGIIDNTYLLNVMYREISHKSQNGTVFHFAFPSIGTKRSSSNNPIGKNETASKDHQKKQRPTKDYHWRFLCSLSHAEFKNDTDQILKRIYDGYNSYYSRIEAVLANNAQSSIKWLNLEYLHKNAYYNNELNVFRGFFATANVGQRKNETEKKKSGNNGNERSCYMGTFYVSGAELYFTGGGFIYSNDSDNLKWFLEKERKIYET